MMDQDEEDAKFGETMFGTEKISKQVSETAQEMFEYFTKNIKVKECFPASVLVSGLGTGKSTFLDQHLNILRENCTNPKLLTLLNDDHYPLVLNVTFNNDTSFTSSEQGDGNICLSRRLLQGYFNIPWSKALELTVPTGLALDTILYHHKKMYNISPTDQVAIIINIDELNNLLDKRQNEDKIMRNRVAQQVVETVHMLQYDGIRNSPLLSLFTSTTSECFRGLRMHCIVSTLPLLTYDQVLCALRLCNVPEDYFKNPEFLQLLTECGGVPRLVRKVLERVSMKYNPDCIASARYHVLDYLSSSMAYSQELKVVHMLLDNLVLGTPILMLQIPISVSSTTGKMITYEHLQRYGSVWMNPIPNTYDSRYQVVIPLLAVPLLCNNHRNDPIVQKVTAMLKYFNSLDCTGMSFEEFCVQYHAFKMNSLAHQPQYEHKAVITLGEFYGNIEMNKKLTQLQFKLSKTAQYNVHKARNIFPIGISGIERDSSIPSQEGTNCLTIKAIPSNGVIYLNINSNSGSDDATIDINAIMRCPLTEKSSQINLIRTLFCTTATSTETLLTEKMVKRDRNKAITAVKTCPHYITDKIITVHITNSTVSPGLNRRNASSIIIGADNLNKFFGPVLGPAILHSSKQKHTRKYSSMRPTLVPTLFPSVSSSGVSMYSTAKPSTGSAQSRCTLLTRRFVALSVNVALK